MLELVRVRVWLGTFGGRRPTDVEGLAHVALHHHKGGAILKALRSLGLDSDERGGDCVGQMGGKRVAMSRGGCVVGGLSLAVTRMPRSISTMTDV